ncbi:YciE/YciF ferroxidase family protein [Prosthecomicrobium sp. N25]|uniref:YciE/YciF ferroxidase family protein n=1 Tax=Prosthecomicrobium sp. N25 TaxID=3129254 RepID=UPI003077D72A
MKDLNDLFGALLKDVLHAERQAVRVLPGLVRRVGDSALKEALEAHHRETVTQAERLERIFALLGRIPRAETCEAIQGLVDEARAVTEDAGDADTRDAGVLAAAQAIEHYEIARYGTLAAWAEELGMDEAAGLLRLTLDEEKRADALLSGIARQRINRKARAA